MKNDEWYGDGAGVGPARSGFCLAAGGGEGGSGAAGQRRYSQAGCFKECFKFNAFDMSHTTGGVLENAWASGRAGERGEVEARVKDNLEFRRATSYSSRETFVSKRTESSSLSLAL